MRDREWRLLLVESIGPFALIYLSAGCTQQLTEYAESGRAQEHSDAAVGGILGILTNILSDPIGTVVTAVLFAVPIILVSAVGWLLCKSLRRRGNRL